MADRKAEQRAPGKIKSIFFHLHLVSDSTGETLEMLAKASLAQFDDTDVVRHFWPMVRSRQHLERIVEEFKSNPGLVLYTLVNAEIRSYLEERCRALGLPHVAALDAVTSALEERLGQEARGRPGRQHTMDEAYFRRVDAIQFTIAQDDGTKMKGKGKQFVPHGRKVMMAFPGGAGYGQPQDRAPDQVKRDLALGYITADFAKTHYGLSAADIKDVLHRAKLGEVFK